MKYKGSKNRIAKHLLPIMLEYAAKADIRKWVEPFVGGANMIDKVPSSFERIGYDLNPHTIAALIAIRDNSLELPQDVSEEFYEILRGLPPGPVTSWVRFVCSFGGKFENGFARSKGRNHAAEGKRNALKQRPYIQGVIFETASYLDIKNLNRCIIYCDPPYEGTSGYKTGAFNHSEFWAWCRKMSENNIVFISEYKAPSDFICIWSGEVKTNFASSRKEATHTAVEKLFIYSHPELF